MSNSNKLKHRAAVVLTLVSLIVVGCSAANDGHIAVPCRVSLDAICATAISNYFANGQVQPARSGLSRGPLLVPLVAPVTMANGELAAEADCYAAVEAGGPWLVYAHLAIPPRSEADLEHLRNESLCADGGPEQGLAFGSPVNDFGSH